MTTDMKTKFLAIIVAVGLSFTPGHAQTTDTVLTVSQNPFASSTSLTIHDLSSDTVTFKIYNAVGQIVADFFDSLILSGTFTVTFTADSLPDGIYFASLTKNGQNHPLKLIKDQSAAGLPDKQIDKSIIQVFPNPTVDLLTISTDKKIIGFELYDLHGRQLLQSKNGQQNTIDMKNFDNGLYLLHLKTNEMTYIKRIIKK
jgi:hypothetical protein